MDRFIVRNSAMWQHLDELAERARKSGSRLAPQEVDELVALYQRTAAQLSYARTYYDDPGLTSRLTLVVAKASGAVYGTRGRAGNTFKRFLTETFPVAVYRSRRFIAASAALFFVPAIAVGAWLARSPEALDVAVPKDTQQAVLDTEFEDYYSREPAQQFSTRVLVNNIQVSFFAFAFGALLIPTAALLLFNALSLGVAAGLFIHAGQAGKFFGLILPHGLLELTAIVIAGAAGFRLGWAMLFPGDQPRGEALADEGRRSVVIVLGLMLCFLVAGLIEGFVTPSGLPTGVRVAVGVAVEVVFVSWVVTRGRVAEAAGLTGRFDEPSLEDQLAQRPFATAAPSPSA
jgi:uncharacterized membrane protein SpoIIM required for sporulation